MNRKQVLIGQKGFYGVFAGKEANRISRKYRYAFLPEFGLLIAKG
jgi:hypothetical protein